MDGCELRDEVQVVLGKPASAMDACRIDRDDQPIEKDLLPTDLERAQDRLHRRYPDIDVLVGRQARLPGQI